MAGRKQQQKALAAVNLDLFQLADRPPPAPATIYTRIRQHERRTTTARPTYELTFPKPTLPDVAELYRMFDFYNWTYFNGQLPRVSIEYSDRMNSAGSYTPQRKLIRIGRRYHLIFPEELSDTLKHEMIHIRHHNHDAAFKAEARRIGTSVRAKAHPALRKPPRYIYICPNCRQEFPRQKRLRMASCGFCTRGKEFDRRFKLKLLRSAARRSR